MIPSFKIYRQVILTVSISLSLIFLCHLPVAAQFTVSGRLLNKADKKDVSDASVFFNNATIGAKTNNNGNFTLLNVKPGTYELIISIIGFDTYHQTIRVNDGPVNLGNLEISARPIALKEVRIRSVINSIWRRNYQWFKDGFLGTSSLANECKILNPEILDFDYKAKTDSLSASSDDFLVIENNALGYKIKYLIDYFVRCDSGRKIHYEGSVLFENMKGTPGQEKRWQKRRQEVYQGSAMHFLRSAIYNRLDDEGFRVFQYAIYSNPGRPSDSLIQAKIKRFRSKIKSENSRYRDSLTFWLKKSEFPKMLHSLLNFPLNGNEIVGRTDRKGIYTLGCENDGLYIMYNKTHHFPKNGNIDFLTSRYNDYSTLLNFNSLFVIFDSNGWVINPNGLAVIGAWSKNRVAGLLPTDYDPFQQ
jgi:hypothetical protein